jgi:hypothetical protein
LPENIAPRLASRSPIITKFTVFKSVPFERGQIKTGWNFLTSAQKYPTDQYCYYTESLEAASGLDVRIDIGTDEKMDAPKTLPKGFDVAAAFNRCVWFKRDAP